MMNILRDKKIVLGVTGGIAAYKSAEILRLLQKEGADVRVVMTQSARTFVGILTFRALSGHTVYTDVLEEDASGGIRHVDWAEWADAVVVAPATANIIGKFAGGIADDALSTFMLAVRAPVVICPAMNTNMYESRQVQRNLDVLEKDGFHIIEPGSGELACGVTGAGRLPEPSYIVDRLKKVLFPKDLKGRKVLVTAGPTMEPIDPVRYISNHSSGKMGYAVARAAEYRGAEVVLVSGPTNIAPPNDVELAGVKTVREMYDAVFQHQESSDIIVKVAAVADYRAKEAAEHKIKKDDDEFSLVLEKNPDILKALGEVKKNQFLVGFAAETRDLAENAGKKLEKKNLDMIVGNLVGDPSSGFGTDTNKVTFFFREGGHESVPSMEKDAVAHLLLDRVMQRLGQADGR